jgi:AICAR transformylase/IMP cyclohydrolase PurH
MINSDPTSILGGWVMTNFPITAELADLLRLHRSAGKPNLFDGIAAPAFTDGASYVLERKAGKCRMLVNPALEAERTPETDFMLRPVRGGFLRQPVSAFTLDLDDPRVTVHGQSLTAQQRSDLLLAWAIGST